VGFCLFIWAGAGVSLIHPMASKVRPLSWFAAVAFLSGVVVAMAFSVPGISQLFFLYIGMVVIAPIAGFGLSLMLGAAWRQRFSVTPIVLMLIAILVAFAAHAVGGRPSLPLAASPWAMALQVNRVEPGLLAYTEPASFPMSAPSEYASSNLFLSQRLRLTPAMLSGLDWARNTLASDDVIATNVPGAALYAGLCECREFYQTPMYTPEFLAGLTDSSVTSLSAWRERRLRSWMAGVPGSVEALRESGVTYLFVDGLNGAPVATSAEMGKAVFAQDDFSIYKIG
jgi:hypothetical protein